MTATFCRAFHERHGIHTQSWSPLGRGKLLEDPDAGRHGRTPAQVVIRWHLDSNLIVIPKTVNPTRSSTSASTPTMERIRRTTMRG